MRRLSSPIADIKAHYDVIVIGSGYGGAIAASRLSRAGKAVCVLERGKERQPGEFPSTSLEGAEELQVDLPACHNGSRTGLFDIRVNHDISVLVGCGLGGTSLINANVSLRPDPRVFEDPRWPTALRDEGGRRLDVGFELAEKMLGANPYPEDQPLPPKALALKTSAASMGHRFYRLPLNVTFTDGHNHAGVWQKACALCGDCVSGCNHGAKNSVLMNYLPDAKRHGAQIFVETSVRTVERGPDGGWIVHYQLLSTGRESFEAPTLFVSADIVILAAGSLGSTEILMRSRDAGKLTISERLGLGFGGNGDMLGFGYNGTPEIRSLGLGQSGPEDGRPLGHERAIGPTITGAIDMRGNDDWRSDMIIEEGVIPGVLAPLMPAVQSAAARAGINTAPERVMEQSKREIDSGVLGPYHGATSHTQTYLGMCHDSSDGAMVLEQDRLRIAWQGIGRAPLLAVLNERLMEATRPLEGIYIANPLWADILGKSLITVHPLGGCTMADAAEGGVVDHTGKVFSSSSGTAVHEGLYVCDGAILPTSMGVNPLLTISAFTERCCMIMAEERGFTIDYSPKGPIREVAAPRAVGVRFTETMKGWFSPADDDDYAAAARRGEAQGSAFSFIVTIAADDVDAMIASPEHEGKMVGTVGAPSLSPSPLAVTQGIFNLFVEDGSSPGACRMKYRMLLTAEDGRTFTMIGFKVLRPRPFWELWHDATTLYITLHEGKDDSGPVLGRGELKINPGDFVRLLATIDATNTSNAAERLTATAKFGRYFAGALYDRYGGVSAPARELFSSFEESEEAKPRKRRPLRVCAPALFPGKASDGTAILLTRYAGGSRGPVILSHGLGASSGMFSIDTIDTNLLEYLFAVGYDVWLFDDRGSSLFPSARAPHTADDVAKKDWPAAVAAVLSATSAASVQVVAHGLGAITFAMAMLSGLSGVRSAVCSQAATHLVTPTSSLLRGGLWAPDLASALGFASLCAAARDEADWISSLFKRALERDAEGTAALCDSEACSRITFMYSQLYEHAKLDPATHAALHEVYEETSAKLLESVSTMVRRGYVVDAAGEDVYLPQIERMAIPIRFIHGSENKCFLPASTEKAMAALGDKNGAALYSREVIAGYGHDDCIFGQSAAIDVFPKIHEHIEKSAHPPARVRIDGRPPGGGRSGMTP